MVQSEGWGIYAFWVPPAERYLGMCLYQDGEEPCGVDTPGCFTSQTEFFSLADLMLQELGWVPAT